MNGIHKLASAGAIVSIIGAALLTAGSFQQEFVVGSIENTTSNETCLTGKLGVYDSSYYPQCSHALPGAEFTSDTLDFWPMLPEINSYGANSEQGMPGEFALLGLSGAPFTTCASYMPQSYENVSGVINGAWNLALSGLIQQYPTCSVFQNIPTNFSEPLSWATCGSVAFLCPKKVSVFGCMQNIYDFLGMMPPDQTTEILLLFIEKFVFSCRDLGAETKDACMNGYWFWTSLYTSLKMPDLTTETNYGFVGTLVQQCVNSVESQEAIAMAQRCVTAGQVFLWLGVLFALATPFFWYYHKAIHVFPAVSLLIAGIVYITALMVVYRAPLFGNVTSDCPPGQLCYESGGAMYLALVGLACCLSSAILFGLSPFLCTPKISQSAPPATKEAEDDQFAGPV